MTDVTPSLLHGRYQVVAVVGRGGEGTLVRAVDRRHGRDVALKLRRVPADPRDADRLLVESRTLLSLHPHPGLPLARDDFFEDDRHVLVMDWVEGVDLGAVLTEHGQPGLPASTVLRWLAPVAEALTHLHTTDPPVVHGDVKPANLVLTPSGRVVLVDFGVSSTRGLRPRGGTPGYRAPEVAAGAVPTRAADVFGLAATAFALLSGGPPSGILPAWSDIDPQRAARLERALRRGLAFDVAQRTATPGELVEELRAGWDSEPLPTGVVTFLATDVVGSTRLWQDLPDTAPGLLAEHLLVVDRAVERYGGRRIGDAIQGDATMSAFHRASDGVRAGIDLQRALAGGRVQVHCAAHTGEAPTIDGIPAGATLSRVARIRAFADAGQVLVSSTTARLAAADLPRDVGLIDLGPHRLDGFDRPEALFAIDAPGLIVPPDPSQPPYRGLLPYDVDDDESFFGRDREIDICLERLAASSLLAVVGPSGSGKSSLVRAGVASRLRRSGRSVVVFTPGSDPHAALVSALETAGPTTVLIVDQIEELFAPDIEPEKAGQFLDDLVERLEVGPVVVALRADHVGSIGTHPDFARRLETGLHLVTPLTEGELRSVIEGPAHAAGLRFEPGLVELLLGDIRGEPGALPHLSFALAETWSNRDGRLLTVDGYLATGGLRRAIATAAERLYETLPPDQRQVARGLFLRLVTPAPDGEAMRQRIDPASVITDEDHRHVVDVFVRSRLVMAGDSGLELAHEALVREWPRLRTWLDDDVEGQRILRHLAVTADGWSAMGRPDSELYRGNRLAQAAEWQERTGPDLRAVEHAFLDASTAGERAAAESTVLRLRHQARQNRRLRASLVGVAALLAVAMVAGVLAVRQARRADRAAVAADARRVGAQALVANEVDRSLLLALEGVGLDDTVDTRANLMVALARNPGLIASTRGDGTAFISGEVSPDGKVVTVGRGFGGLSFYSTSSRELLGTYDEVWAWTFEYRPDGQQVAVSATERLGDFDAPFPTPAVRLVDVRTLEDEPVQLGGTPGGIYPHAVHYSADGRFLAVTFHRSVVVWDLRSPQAPVGTFPASSLDPDSALSSDGSVIYVGTTDPPKVAAYEVATGRALASAIVPGGRLQPSPDGTVPGGLLQLSPDGTVLAASVGNDIVLLDAATLTEQGRLQGHVGEVGSMQFSHDGRLLATGSEDRTSIVWDVATRLSREQLRGHGGGVWGVDFSPDDHTLYTTGGDGTVLTWDLQGDRRWIPSLPVAEPVTNADYAVQVSPTGEAIAYLSDSTSVQFVDLATGHPGPVISAGHAEWGVFEWRPDGRRFATAGADGFVRVWDWPSGELVAERSVAPGHIAALDYTADGKHLLVGERAGGISMIDAETLELGGTTVQLDLTVVFAYVAPDGRRAIAMSGDEFVVVDLTSGGVVHRGPTGFVAGFSEFSPDGRRFAMGGSLSGEVRLLDVDTGKWIGPARIAHSGIAWFTAYSPDGATFVTTGRDGKVALWDGHTGAPLGAVLAAPPEFVSEARYLPDGHTVLIASLDGTISSWDTRPERAIEFACQIAGRNLTPDEWRDALGTSPYHETCAAPRHP